MTDAPEGYVTRAEAASIAGVTVEAIRQARLKERKVGSRNYVERAALERWAEVRQQRARARVAGLADQPDETSIRTRSGQTPRALVPEQPRVNSRRPRSRISARARAILDRLAVKRTADALDWLRENDSSHAVDGEATHGASTACDLLSDGGAP